VWAQAEPTAGDEVFKKNGYRPLKVGFLPAKAANAKQKAFEMERSGLHNWLYIGEAYLKYRTELEKVGLSDEDGPTKFPYVDRALALYQKKEVFRAVKDMSLWQFISFARGRPRYRCRNRILGSGGIRSTSGTG
jgi:hypothetical protein